MKNSLPPDQDLHDLLHEWRVDLPDDPALARQVWARVGEARPESGPMWLENLARLFMRPVMATAAIAMFVLAGGLVATWHHSDVREERFTRLAAEYAQFIDPLLMTRPAVDHSSAMP